MSSIYSPSQLHQWIMRARTDPSVLSAVLRTLAAREAAFMKSSAGVAVLQGVLYKTAAAIGLPLFSLATADASKSHASASMERLLSRAACDRVALAAVDVQRVSTAGMDARLKNSNRQCSIAAE